MVARFLVLVALAAACVVFALAPRAAASCNGVHEILLDATNSSALVVASESGPYETSMDCVWTVRARAPLALALEIVELDTECGYDYVFVYDGETTASPMIGMFSGSEFSEARFFQYEPMVASRGPSGSALTVEFVSDAFVTASGFILKAFASECPHDCAGNGVCVNGTCVCEPGWSGDLCRTWHAVNSSAEACWSTCACSDTLSLDYADAMQQITMGLVSCFAKQIPHLCADLQPDLLPVCAHMCSDPAFQAVAAPARTSAPAQAPANATTVWAVGSGCHRSPYPSVQQEPTPTGATISLAVVVGMCFLFCGLVAVLARARDREGWEEFDRYASMLAAVFSPRVAPFFVVGAVRDSTAATAGVRTIACTLHNRDGSVRTECELAVLAMPACECDTHVCPQCARIGMVLADPLGANAGAGELDEVESPNPTGPGSYSTNLAIAASIAAGRADDERLRDLLMLIANSQTGPAPEPPRAAPQPPRAASEPIVSESGSASAGETDLLLEPRR